MDRIRARVAGFAVLALAWGALPLAAQRIPFEKRFFNEQVLRPHAQPVVPIFEGWYPNQDGTYELCFGYFNLNLDEPLDIPLGERNFLAPSVYDGRQPTHFTPVPGMTPTSPFTSRLRRIWCAFTVTAPATFADGDQIWWTLESSEGPVRVPGTINTAYVLDEPRSDGMGEVAPTLRFAEGAAPFQGRKGAWAPTRSVRVSETLELELHLEHPFEEQLWVGWLKYRGPGMATFRPAEERVRLSEGRGVARTSVSFSEPGTYEVLVQSIDGTANFEFHCCWTNGYIPVEVTR